MENYLTGYLPNGHMTDLKCLSQFNSDVKIIIFYNATSDYSFTISRKPD